MDQHDRTFVDLAIAKGFVTFEKVRKCIDESRKSNCSVAEMLKGLGWISDEQHAEVLKDIREREAQMDGAMGDADFCEEVIRRGLLSADLVYLSCCESSRRLTGSGSGFMDFAGAFLHAGARSVIASTLRVDDEASRYLAERFYHHWLGGKSKAVALRSAQQDVRAASSRWRHPYFWAYYRLIGQA